MAGLPHTKKAPEKAIVLSLFPEPSLYNIQQLLPHSDCVEIYELRVEDAIDGCYLTDNIRGHIVVDGQYHDVRALNIGLADLHARDIDFGSAHDGTNRTDDTRPIDMRADEDTRMRVDIDTVVIDHHDAAFLAEQRTLNPDGGFFRARRNSNQVGEVLRFLIFDLRHLDVALFSQSRRIDVIHVAFENGVQQTLDNGSRDHLRIDLGDIAVVLDLDTLHRALSQ